MQHLLFGTDIPDPTMPYEVGDDGEYEPDPLGMWHQRQAAIEQDIFRGREEFSEKQYRKFGTQIDDVVRPSAARRTVTIVQIAALFAFAVVLIVASMRSAGILHG